MFTRKDLSIKAANGMTVEFFTLNKSTAETLLSMVDEKRQRKKSQVVIQKYSRDIEKNMWDDGVCIFIVDEHGRLIDGQHRCEAIAKTNGVIENAILITKAPEKAIHHIDRIFSRSIRNIMQINGASNAAQRAAEIAKLRLNLDGIVSPSDSEIMQLVESRPEYSLVCELFFTAPIRGITIVPFKLATAEMYIRDEEKTGEFVEKVKTGAYCEPGDPALALRNLLLTDQRSASSHIRKACYSKCVKAMDAYLHGIKVAKLYATGKWHD